MVLPKPTAIQYAWHEQERMTMISFCPSTWQGREYDDLSTPLDRINPAGFDPDQWCDAALAWGSRELLLVAKHTGGFCLWQTRTSPYGLKETPFRGGRGDIVDEVYRACRRRGLAFGLYLSPADETFGAYNGGGGRTTDPARQETYNAVFRAQLQELLERCPDTREVWFDGGIVIPVADILDRYAPDAVVFQGKERSSIRWAGNEAGEIPYPTWDTLSRRRLESGLATGANSDPRGDAWAPVEADVPLYNHAWFWSRENEAKRRSLDDLLRVYYNSVGRGAALMLNATPDTRGLIPDDDMARYREFGAELDRRFSPAAALASTTGAVRDFYRTPNLGAGRETALNLYLGGGRDREVNHLVLGERCEEGERIRSFTIDARTDGAWRPLSLPAPYRQLSMIGRKLILPFPTIQASAFRLRIREADGVPAIRFMSAYHVTGVDMPALAASLGSAPRLFDCFSYAAVEPRAAPGSWEDYTLDLTPCVREARQYVVTFEPAPEAGFELAAPVLVLEGRETDGLVEELSPGVYRVTRSATVDGGVGKSTALRFRCRQKEPRGAVPVTVQ